MIEIWYAPKDILFTRPQMVWLIETFGGLDGDEWVILTKDWPPDPESRETVDTSRHLVSPFENVAGIRAELSWRLDRTKKDGNQLISEVVGGSGYLGIFSKDAKNALNYISGWRRKEINYPLWKAQRKYKTGQRK